MPLWQIRVLQPNLGGYWVDKTLAAATWVCLGPNREMFD